MKNKIAIIGLGYVGLPLAVEFGKIFDTVGFDINEARVKELKAGKIVLSKLKLRGLLKQQSLVLQQTLIILVIVIFTL